MTCRVVCSCINNFSIVLLNLHYLLYEIKLNWVYIEIKMLRLFPLKRGNNIRSGFVKINRKLFTQYLNISL